MTETLSQNVSYIAGMLQTSAIPARLDLHDDRLTLTTLNRVGDEYEVVLDAPLSDVTVTGSGAILVFKVGDIKRRVDFSFSARVIMAVPGGALRLPEILRESGIYNWLSAFRERGSTVNYFSVTHIWLVALGVFAVIAAVIAVIGINRM